MPNWQQPWQGQPLYTQPQNYQQPGQWDASQYNQPTQGWQPGAPLPVPPPFRGKPPKPPKKPLTKRDKIIGVGCFVVVLLFFCGVVGVIGSAVNANHGTTVAASTPTATTIIVNSQATDTPIPATARATPKPKPAQATSSVISPTYETPRLGGPISDFYGKYGTPNNHSGGSSYGSTYHWFRDGSSNVDGLIVWNLTHYPQVDSIDVRAINGDMPDTSAAIPLCTVYNPSDAHQIKTIPLVNASGQASGFDAVYVSSTLANEFSPDDFTDASGNNVQRGSFDIQYLYKGDGTQSIVSCSILPGEQQTSG